VRSKLLLLAAAVVAALALGAVAHAATRASTTVTIKGKNGNFEGTVDSPKLQKCAKNRLVRVFKQKGAEQNPSGDTEIGSDTSELAGDHGEWNTGNSGFKKGRFYARAPRTPNCKADSSPTITIGPTISPTTVTIEGENGDYHGVVRSPNIACLDGRTVTVYKQTGAAQSPANDDEIGMDTTQRHDDHAEWSIGNSGFKTGRFYARVSATAKCQRGSSKTIQR
jgi:hypothetical protein